MLRKLALIVAISPAIWLSAAHALGLGEIDVNSHLNQRFSAVIPLTSVTSEEAENLLVRLADSDDFSKAGIERADYLSTLTFQVVADAKNPRIVINSKQLAREPFLSFLLDVRSSTGRVLREYTVLLDPPAYGEAAPVAAPAPKTSDFYQTAEESAQTKPQAVAPAAPTPAAAPHVAPPKAAPAPAVVAPAAPIAEAAPAANAPTSYGPVKPQETFWSIATKLRPNASVSMDQMLWALYSNNKQAFEGKGISGLRKGSILKVPSLSAITAVSSTVAKGHLQDLQAPRVVVPAKPKVTAEPAATVVEPTVTAPVAPAPKPVVKAPAAAEKKTPEVVTPPPAPVAKVTPPPAPVVVAPPAVATPPPAPAAVAPAAPEAPATPAADAATQVEPTSETTPAAVPVEQQPVPVEKPAAPAKPVEASDDWMVPALAGMFVLILGLLGFRHWQKKQGEKSAPAPVLTSKASTNLQFWKKAAEGGSSAPAPTKALLVPPPLPSSKPAEKKAEAAFNKPAPAPQPAAKNPLWDDEIPTATTEQPSFDATETFGRTIQATGSVEEYNATNKFESETVKIDLDANDPVSEAEFHLAYGLYDEAALLLENAAEKNPGRSDIRIKLAETYFRASKPHEFDDIAQSLKPQLDSVEWQKIAIMGSQLLPDSPLYRGAVGEAALDNDVDLTFDEPADFSDPSATKVFSSTMSSSAASSNSRANSTVLDFKLEDLEAPVTPAAKPTVASASAAASTGNTLEFSLSDFDLSKPEPKAAATAPAAEPASHADEALEFDLGSFDSAPAKHEAEASAAISEDINLDDFDLGELADDSHAISAGDEAGTKLDLARAYVDMGDNEMARSLLNEVLAQGSDEQKADAQALIQRLA
ncbi:FimV/HubP family polar landmark protein [Stenotrophobium rhamnosiphilum]|nr:FimV/HubP family polar landmark protein [Stenotrophobium rhamnosiphilum]